MKKIKEFSKKYLIGFILGVLSAGIISAYAATYFPSNQTTYDNTNSKLKSENVQDAIDELYGVCFPKPAGEQIIENAGLEKDPYECRYFFTGTNPNNYITFNDEKAGWRIISVECDGTIKIMRITDIENQKWDTSGSNNWARPASLNTYLNGTYYNELNATAQSQIVAKDFSIGEIRDYDDLATQINKENSIKWNGKVALPTLSEYIRSNSNKSGCGSISSNNASYSSCQNTTWMSFNNPGNWWTLSPDGDGLSSNKAFSVNPHGYINDGYVGGTNYTFQVLPVLYLNSEFTLTGNGTQSDPYVVNS